MKNLIVINKLTGEITHVAKFKFQGDINLVCKLLNESLVATGTNHCVYEITN
jgi:hypothetical protein